MCNGLGAIDILSFFRPSGVSSKAQAKINARGNPINTKAVTKVTDQSGSFKTGKVVAVTSIKSQATIA